MNDLVLQNVEIVHSVQDLLNLGHTLVQSGLLPKTVGTKEAAAAIILKGRELGIGPMEALSSINVILGKPTVSPQLMLALARRTKELENIAVEDDGSKCTVVVKRKGQDPIATSFSMDDAQKMGLSNKDNWNKQPKVMRQWRAMAANLRLSFPDAISGLYTHEEMGAVVDEEGELVKLPDPVIEGKAKRIADTPDETPHAVNTAAPEERKLYNTPSEKDALTIIEMLNRKASEYDKSPTEEVVKKMRGLMDGWLNTLTMLPMELTSSNRDAADEYRRIFLYEVFGVRSSNEMTPGQIGATLNWLGLQKGEDKKYSGTAQTDTAKKLIDLVLLYVGERLGQQKLV